ncbi:MULTISPECIES: flagellar motor switch protein FliN [unclassified Nocardioides]|uniref:flagellar motor switch protein FliN n=1 Tax=unclassified Nocardioides TaxID=2615069 RepID=UPI0030148294
MTPDLDPRLSSLLAAAADAVAPLLPAADELAPGDPQPATEHITDLFAGAAVAGLTGPLRGMIGVLVGRDLVDALKDTPLGSLDLAAAAQPALDAAAEVLGCSVNKARQVTLDTVDAELGDDLWAVPLIGMTISGALLVPTSVLAAAAGVELPESEVLDVVDAVEVETSDSPEAVATTTATSEAPAAAGPVADLGDAAPYDTADHEAYDEPTALPPGRPALALPPTARLRPIAGGRGIEMLHGVEMEVTVELGRTRMPVRELLALAPGAVLELDRAAGSPADLLVNGRLIARGEVVVVDEDFGLRVTEIINDESAAS